MRTTPPLLILLTLIAPAACLDSAPGNVASTADAPDVAPDVVEPDVAEPDVAEPDVAEPVPPDRIVQVAAGRTGHCVRTAAGRVTCSDGQAITESGASSLSACGTFVWHEELQACVIVNGRVRCGSANGAFELITPADPVALSIGDHMGCILDSAGTISCFDPIDFEPGAPALKAVAPVPGAVALSCGYLFCCALDAAGHISCWGDDIVAVALTPPPQGGFVSISAGAYHACALDRLGLISCWGSEADSYYPDVFEARAIDSGFASTCAIGAAPDEVVCASAGESFSYTFPGPILQLEVDAEICALIDAGDDDNPVVMCVP